MQSIKELYKIGNGPSSSHTMGPRKTAEMFKNKFSSADYFKVILYGSLASTGVGHLTDYIIKKAFEPIKSEIVFNYQDLDLRHPNTMDMIAYKDNVEIGRVRAYSIGGGSIFLDGDIKTEDVHIYPLNSFKEIKEYCFKKSISISDYVIMIEGEDIIPYLKNIYRVMKNSIREGLSKEGVLPGGLNVERKARYMHDFISTNEIPTMHEQRLVSAYAYAVSEENASGGLIVTAPTCGASGILPAVLKYAEETYGYNEDEIVRALATAGLIGNLIKNNASISGAECGCQAEVGTASSMAAAALSELRGMSIDKIEYASEIAMEHSLGLTCDPVLGLVQIPCIERNVVGAMRAIHASNLAYSLLKPGKVSFDTVVDTMYQTGLDMNSFYKETSKGGLAKKYINKE